MDPVTIPAKFEVSSFTRFWDNRGYSRNLGSPWMRPRPFLPSNQGAFVFMDALNTSAKFEVRSFTRSWDNRGYSKNVGSPWIRPRCLFSQIFKRLLFGWTVWIYLPNLKFVPLGVPEIVGGTQKIGKSLDTLTLPFLPIFNELLFAWTLWIYLPNLKFVALPVSEIIGGTQINLGHLWICPRSLFSKIFHGLVFGCTLWIYLPHLKSLALAVPEIIANPNLGEVEAVWGTVWMVPFERAFVTSYRPSIVTFRDVATFVLQHATSSYPTSSLPKFPHVPLGVGGWPLGYEERGCWAKRSYN